MPKRRRKLGSSRLESVDRSTPSTCTVPASGRIKPIMCLSITLLPVPEPPTTTSDSPAFTSRSIESSTTLPPNDLLTPRSEIFGSSAGAARGGGVE